MAVKKTKARKKVAPKQVAKKKSVSKATPKKAAAQKAGAKRAGAKRAAAKSAATKKSTTVKAKSAKKTTAAKSRSKASSVDGILKRYQKERIAHESKLVSVRDQIHKLTSKIQTYQKQIVKLKSQQLDTENSICTLDIRRDQEVAGLLSSLGINLDSIASIGESVGKKKVDKPTPLFDATHQADDADKPADESPTTPSKPQVDILIADNK